MPVKCLGILRGKITKSEKIGGQKNDSALVMKLGTSPFGKKYWRVAAMKLVAPSE